MSYFDRILRASQLPSSAPSARIEPARPVSRVEPMAALGPGDGGEVDPSKILTPFPSLPQVPQPSRPERTVPLGRKVLPGPHDLTVENELTEANQSSVTKIEPSLEQSRVLPPRGEPKARESLAVSRQPTPTHRGQEGADEQKSEAIHRDAGLAQEAGPDVLVNPPGKKGQPLDSDPSHQAPAVSGGDRAFALRTPKTVPPASQESAPQWAQPPVPQGHVHQPMAASVREPGSATETASMPPSQDPLPPRAPESARLSRSDESARRSPAVEPQHTSKAARNWMPRRQEEVPSHSKARDRLPTVHIGQIEITIQAAPAEVVPRAPIAAVAPPSHPWFLRSL